MSIAAPIARVRARRHPLLVGALWLVELLAAALVVWPLAGVVRATFGAHPRGDLVLFEPGGVALLDFLARGLPPSLAAIGSHMTVTLPLVYVALVLAFGAAIVTLGVELQGPVPARARAAFDQSFERLRALTGQSLLTLLAQILTAGFALLVLSGTSGALAARFGVATADRVGLGVALPFLLAVPVLGAVRDVAAVRLLVENARFLRSIGEGFRLVASRPMLLVEYALRALAGVVLVAIGALIAERIGGRGGAALVFLALLHQLVVLVRVALRASWLAAAIRRTR